MLEEAKDIKVKRSYSKGEKWTIAAAVILILGPLWGRIGGVIGIWLSHEALVTGDDPDGVARGFGFALKSIYLGYLATPVGLLILTIFLVHRHKKKMIPQ